MVNVHEPGPLEGRLAEWPVLATAGALEVRLAETESEVKAAQRLRYRVFYEEMTAIPSSAMREQRMDFDQFDAFCDHLLVIDRELIDEDGQPAVVGTSRLMRDVDAKRAGGFYTSGEYDIAEILSELGSGNLVEIGRSCILRDYRTKPSTMQLLWRGVMVYDLRFSIDLMFGCASL
ncbi:MAG: GNAT family N-acetyltransferase, partial [Rhizomicrobium sp.]